MFRALSLSILILFSSCAQMQKPKDSVVIDESKISPIARQKLAESRELIRQNQLKASISRLAELHDDKLSPLEKALKYNLKGVSHFGSGDVEKSVANFEIAEKYAPRETQLYSQIELNMASAHFKLNQWDQLKARLGQIDERTLNDAEKKKYAQLNHAYAVKFEDHPLLVSSSVVLLSEMKTIADVSASPLNAPMKESFKKLDNGQKIDLLEKFQGQKNIAMAQLAQMEAEDRYMNGDKSGAGDVLTWLSTEYPDNAEISTFVKDFQHRIDNAARISSASIGLVLPMTGSKASFGQKALVGVDTGLKLLSLNDAIKVFTKDSQDSPALGAQAVQELVREENVSFIIGGLFPETAKAEYLEARKYGVLFISLSQVNLPKEEKNQNLIEIQGSIESQVEALLSEDMIRKFGTRIGVIYPDTDGGKAYIEEIWRNATAKNLQVTSISSYPRNTHDFRDTAKLFLGLKHPRERSEEFNLLEDVYAHEKSSIRRVQTLPPVLDFDWVFLASFPQESAQLISTLGYYDANRIKVVGGPSWGSKSMVKEQKRLGTLYFVGEDPADLNQEMLQNFQEVYGKPAGLIEILALDAMKVGSEALAITGDVSGRDDFDGKLKEKGEIRGLASSWTFKNGLWLKKINSLAITRGEIVKLFSNADATN